MIEFGTEPLQQEIAQPRACLGGEAAGVAAEIERVVGGLGGASGPCA